MAVCKTFGLWLIKREIRNGEKGNMKLKPNEKNKVFKKIIGFWLGSFDWSSPKNLSRVYLSIYESLSQYLETSKLVRLDNVRC